MGTTKEPILELKNVKTTFKVPKGCKWCRSNYL